MEAGGFEERMVERHLAGKRPITGRGSGGGGQPIVDTLRALA